MLVIGFVLSQLVSTPAVAVGVTGLVEVDDGTAIRRLVRFDEVSERATVITHDDGTANLRMASGSLVRLGPSTKVTLRRLEQNKPAAKRREVIKLVTGKLWARVTSLFGGEEASEFTLETDNAVAGVRGTSFFAERAGAKDMYAVLRGAIELRRGGKTLKLAGVGAFAETTPGGFGPIGKLEEKELVALQRRVGGVGGGLVARLHSRSAPRPWKTLDQQKRDKARQDIVGPVLQPDTPLALPPPVPDTSPADVTIRLQLPE